MYKLFYTYKEIIILKIMIEKDYNWFKNKKTKKYKKQIVGLI